MSSSTIEISAPQKPLTQCSPNLMPFHLNYSGPAPIATYFRVKPVPAEHEVISTTSQQAADALKVDVSDEAISTQNSNPMDVAGIDSVMDDSQSTQTRNQTVVETKPSPLGARFIAAFRGRTVQGATVNLPEGYGGIVLRALDESRGPGASTSTIKQEAGRVGTGTKAKRGHKAAIRDVDHGDMDVNEGFADASQDTSLEDAEAGSVRILNPSATFSSFVLWNPDLPVVEARDEYLRSLTEWTTLAAEVSHYTLRLSRLITING